MCSKLLYSSFISLKRINTLYSNKWQTEFPNKILNWPLIWQNIHINLCNFKIQSTLWQLIHRNYICAYFLKKIYNTDGICKLCKSFELQRSHVFLECEVIKFIYSYFDSILKNLNNKEIDREEMTFGIYENCTDKDKIRNYLTSIIKHFVFKERNTDFENSTNCKRILIHKIKKHIKEDLEIKFSIAKIQNTVSSFEKMYLIDNIIGQIVNNTLLINL